VLQTSSPTFWAAAPPASTAVHRTDLALDDTDQSVTDELTRIGAWRPAIASAASTAATRPRVVMPIAVLLSVPALPCRRLSRDIGRRRTVAACRDRVWARHVIRWHHLVLKPKTPTSPAGRPMT
jgi:hypothetical protein